MNIETILWLNLTPSSSENKQYSKIQKIISLNQREI